MDRCVYNTQGQIVRKSMKQSFSDSFHHYLSSCDGKNVQQTELPKYIPYINECTPPCCSPIGINMISEKIVDVQYHNDNACKNERKSQLKYRVG